MVDFPAAGKIQHDFFSDMIFPQCGAERSEVITGPKYGVDTSIIRLNNGMAMALTSDPLTLIPSLGLRESAWLSVQILANDMATTGFAPMYAQFVLNLPETIDAAAFKVYWNYIDQYCKEIGLAITGGHTGQVVGQHSTVAGGGTFINVAPEHLMLTSDQAKAGDLIIVTKEAAMTAAAILALSFPETVQNKCGKETYQRAAGLFYQTSSLKDGLIAAELSDGESCITAMHDVTEGGVLGAIYEMAMASGLGVDIQNEALPLGDAQQRVCAVFGIDSRFVVGAGSMIIAAKPGKALKLLERLAVHQIPSNIVGVFTADAAQKRLFENDRSSELQHPGTDAYWNAFYQALNQEWK